MKGTSQKFTPEKGVRQLGHPQSMALGCPAKEGIALSPPAVASASDGVPRESAVQLVLHRHLPA